MTIKGVINDWNLVNNHIHGVCTFPDDTRDSITTSNVDQIRRLGNVLICTTQNSTYILGA
jgi:hypothetical protein